MTENNDVDFESTGSGGVSRRTVTKAMAWAVPAIAIAAPVPAFAASGNPPCITAGEANKLPGGSCTGTAPLPGADVNATKGFVVPFQVTNNTGKTIVLYDAEISSTVNPDPDNPFTAASSTPAFPATVANGQTVMIYIYASGPNSGNFSTTLTALIYWGHPPLPDPDNHPPIQLSWFVPSFPPITGNACIPPTFTAVPGASNCVTPA